MARRRRRTTAGDPVGRLAGAAVALVAAVATQVVAGPANAAQGSWWHDTWAMPEVWQFGDGDGVTVALVDSGVDASLPELADAVVPGVNLLSDTDADDTDDYDVWGHGTTMASLIAGRGGASGVVGVAPAAKILPIVVGESRRGALTTSEQHSTAIRTAVDGGAQVINISRKATIGSEPCPQNVAAAVRYALSKDLVVVAGSGNDVAEPTGFPGDVPAC